MCILVRAFTRLVVGRVSVSSKCSSSTVEREVCFNSGVSKVLLCANDSSGRKSLKKLIRLKGVSRVAGLVESTFRRTLIYAGSPRYVDGLPTNGGSGNTTYRSYYVVSRATYRGKGEVLSHNLIIPVPRHRRYSCFGRLIDRLYRIRVWAGGCS